MNFESLVGHINQVQDVLQAQAAHAVNLSLTSRNWLVGYYIVEYEQHGEDRAKYGDNLINRLAKDINRKGFEPRTLRLYRRIYLIYPQLGTEIGTYLHNNSLGVLDASGNSIWQSATAKLQTPENQSNEIWQSAITKLEEWSTPADWLFNKLNYTSLAYLTSIEDPLKRDILHNPVTLEFLGIESQEIYTETKLESYILNHLQSFLLEMGRGFCFEARQKRILVDQDYFKADLIFYHRILKCHVIIDLKIDRFRHEYASQLNLYMNYYKHEVMQVDDNPPIGLLLCTDYGVTTVQYATEGLSQNLFVSKYRLQLPSEDDIKQYLLENISEEKFKELKEEEENAE